MPADNDHWLRHVSHVQLERMTPDQRQSLHERAERQRTSEMARRTSRMMSSHSVRSRSLLAEGLRQMSRSATVDDYASTQSRWRSAQLASRVDAEQTIRSWSVAEARTSFVWRDEDAEAEGHEQAARLVSDAAQDLGDGSESLALPQNEQLEELMAQLSREPDDEGEVAAKFGMYETYAQEVEKMRSSLFAFVDAHRDSMPSSVARGMDAQLRKVDREDSLGIPDDTRDWFVYHMLRQAERNNRNMSSVLCDFERMLEMLSKNEQSECPICLEAFGPARPAETLGCCHCVCQSCWTHWSAVMHQMPFCPLCRHNEFLGVITTQTRGYHAQLASPVYSAETIVPTPVAPQGVSMSRRWLLGISRLAASIPRRVGTCCSWSRSPQAHETTSRGRV